MSEVGGGSKDGGDMELTYVSVPTSEAEKGGTANDAFQLHDQSADAQPSPQV